MLEREEGCIKKWRRCKCHTFFHCYSISNRMLHFMFFFFS